ncbi:Uncharacterised protein [Vibrio cholerae]|nr:Uncharacterised protein [Vibrio cholerae]
MVSRWRAGFIIGLSDTPPYTQQEVSRVNR